MNSRDKILDNLRSVNPEKVDLPEFDFPIENTSSVQKFMDMAKMAGMDVLESEKTDLLEFLKTLAKNKSVQSSIKAYEEEFPVLIDERDFFNEENTPDVFVCKAHFGVAENAAMWFDDKVLPSRILAFLPEELIIFLSKDKVVATMHEAYEKVEGKNYGYGLFLAGPSKTADIEQTLVTGAQGAKRVTIFLE